MARRIEKLARELVTQLERRMVSHYEGHGEHWKFCQFSRGEHEKKKNFKPHSTEDCEALMPLFIELRALLGLDRCPTCGRRRELPPAELPESAGPLDALLEEPSNDGAEVE